MSGGVLAHLAAVRDTAEEARDRVDEYHPGLVGTHGVLDQLDSIISKLDEIAAVERERPIRLSAEEAGVILSDISLVFRASKLANMPPSFDLLASRLAEAGDGVSVGEQE